MSAVHATTDFYLREFAHSAAMLPARHSARVGRMRAEAMAAFHRLGFPTVRDEDWKYTRLTTFTAQGYAPVATRDITPEQAQTLAADWNALPGYPLVFIDGHFAPQLSRMPPRGAGLEIVSLRQLLEQEDEETLRSLEHAIKQATNGFGALNIAYVSDGAYVRVMKDTQAPAPINLIHLNSGIENSAAHLRNRVWLESGSQAVITESYFGPDAPNYFTNTHTEVQLGPGARLEHYKLLAEGAHGAHIATLQTAQDADSQLACHQLILGGVLVRQEINNEMIASGAECLINGLLVGGGRQHLDVHARIDHRQAHCRSRAYFRGIMDARARGVVDGRITVHPQAQKSDAYLSSKNILLSPHAEMDVKPQLEIYADDVKCMHGTTVGQLDDEALFYLRTRGLEYETARNLVIHAFADEILSRFTAPGVRSLCHRQLQSRMPQTSYPQELP